MSTISSSTDLASKYQKLAAEYSKLRSQFPVLKQAVIQEQAKNAELQAEIQGKDQKSRRVDAELESLVFRNEQLTKRVEFLQEKCQELATPKKNKKLQKPIANGIPRSQSDYRVSDAQQVLQEELSSKLAENENLHSRLFELEKVHELELEGLEEKMRSLEIENVDLQKEMGQIRSRHRAVLEELRADKSSIQDQLDSLSGRFKFLQEEYACLKDNSSSDLDSTKRLLMGRVLIDDSSNIDLNRLNVSLPDTDLDRVGVEVFQNLTELFEKVFSGLSSFFTYLEQRSKLYPCDGSMEPITETNQKLSQVLLSGAPILKSFQSAVFHFLEKCQNNPGFNLFSDQVPCLVSGYQELLSFLNATFLPVFLKSIDEECAVSWCGQRLQKENEFWKEAMENLVGAYRESFDTLAQSLAILITGDIDERNQLLEHWLVGLVEIAANLAAKTTDAANQFSAKVACEHQLPTATKRLRTTNECVLAVLHSLAKNSHSLADSLEAKVDIVQRFLHRALITSSIAVQFTDTATAFMDKLAITALKGPQKSDSGVNLVVNALGPSEEEEELKRVKTELNGRMKQILELEKEKEHWALEAQLLTVKLETCQKSPENCVKTATDSGVFERELVEDHYKNRLDVVLLQLQKAEGTVAFYEQECTRFLKTTQLVQKQKEKMKEELKIATETIIRLNDELNTTRQGYESQMGSLTEALAEMNQRLSSQTDEIDMLKQALAEKSHGHKRMLFK